MAKHKHRIQKSKGKERSRQRQAHEAAAAAVPPLPDDILRTIFLLNASDADIPTRRRRKIIITCLFVCRLWYNILMDHGQVWGRLLLLEACVKESVTSHAVSETKKRAKGSNLWVEVDDTSLLGSARDFEDRMSPPFLLDIMIWIFDKHRIEKIVIKFGDSFGLYYILSRFLQPVSKEQLPALKFVSFVLPAPTYLPCRWVKETCDDDPPPPHFFNYRAPALCHFSCNFLPSKFLPTNVLDLSITPYAGASIITLSETLTTLRMMHRLERLSIEHTFRPESSSALHDLPCLALPNLKEADLKCDYDALMHLCSRIDPTKEMAVVAVVPGYKKHEYTRREMIEISRLCDILLSSNQGSVEPSQGLECTMTEKTFSFRTFHLKAGGLKFCTTSFSLSRRTGLKRKPYTSLSIPSFRKYSHVRLSIPDKQFRRDRNMPFIIDSFVGATTLEINKSTLFSLLIDHDNLLDFQGGSDEAFVIGLFPKLRRVYLRPTSSWKMKKDEERATFQAFGKFLERRQTYGLQNVTEIFVDASEAKPMGEVIKALEGVEGVKVVECDVV